jgi:hypothetical protein
MTLFEAIVREAAEVLDIVKGHIEEYRIMVFTLVGSELIVAPLLLLYLAYYKFNELPPMYTRCTSRSGCARTRGTSLQGFVFNCMCKP